MSNSPRLSLFTIRIRAILAFIITLADIITDINVAAEFHRQAQHVMFSLTLVAIFLPCFVRFVEGFSTGRLLRVDALKYGLSQALYGPMITAAWGAVRCQPMPLPIHVARMRREGAEEPDQVQIMHKWLDRVQSIRFVEMILEGIPQIFITGYALLQQFIVGSCTLASAGQPVPPGAQAYGEFVCTPWSLNLTLLISLAVSVASCVHGLSQRRGQQFLRTARMFVTAGRNTIPDDWEVIVSPIAFRILVFARTAAETVARMLTLTLCAVLVQGWVVVLLGISWVARTLLMFGMNICHSNRWCCFRCRQQGLVRASCSAFARDLTQSITSLMALPNGYDGFVLGALVSLDVATFIAMQLLLLGHTGPTKSWLPTAGSALAEGPLPYGFCDEMDLGQCKNSTRLPRMLVMVALGATLLYAGLWLVEAMVLMRQGMAYRWSDRTCGCCSRACIISTLCCCCAAGYGAARVMKDRSKGTRTLRGEELELAHARYLEQQRQGKHAV